MISGIVYWNEIITAVGQETGIRNLNNLEDKLRNIVLDAEIDIAPGGCIVKKQRDYTLGDGYYDGTWIMLPKDFTGEYYYEKITSAVYMGDRLKLHEEGPETVSLRYMGFIMDSEGNPVTTRNHKDAVVARCVWKLYAPKVFDGKGDKQQLAKYKSDYDTLVMASRGNDAMPTYQEYMTIGKTMRMSKAELEVHHCGYQYAVSEAHYDGDTPTMGGSGGDCGDLTVDMVAVFNSNLIT